MNLSRFIQKYNIEDALLVLSSFPKKGELYSHNICAVSGFTKLSLKALQQAYPTKKIIVLTMQVGNKEEIYEEDGMLIIRCFQRNKPRSYVRLLRYASLFTNVKPLLIEFEFSSFGDTLSTIMLLPVVWALRGFGKQITLVLHQVLLNLHELTGHIGIAKRSAHIKLLSFGMQKYLNLLAKASDTVVVLEKSLKERLAQFVPDKKIVVIPHGVPFLHTLPAKQKTRRTLGLRKDDVVILSFGYLTWYKGTDFLLKVAEQARTIGKKRLVIVLAGGPSFTQGKKAHYQRYIESIRSTAKNLPNVILTGFVPEQSIPLYYAATDMVVFPYRSFMSSSGPLSLALGFGKPFLLSSNLRGILKSEDIATSLRAHGLTNSDIVFKLDPADFMDRITATLQPTRYQKICSFSKTLAEKRLFSSLASSYGSIVFPAKVRTNAQPATVTSFNKTVHI